MARTVKQETLRRNVLVNFGALVGVVALFLVGEYGGWHPLLAGATLAVAALFAVTFSAAYVRSGLWRLVHTSCTRLDEREVQWTHEALRRAYRIVGVLTLVVLAVLSLLIRFSVDLLTFRGHFSLGLALMITLSYLVNTLPAALLAARRHDWIID
jgi:uncharacterized integral membrane protein